MKSLIEETARYSNSIVIRIPEIFKFLFRWNFDKTITEVYVNLTKKKNLFFKFAFSRKNLTEIWRKNFFLICNFKKKSYWKIVGKAVIRHLPVKTGEVVISTTPTLMSKSFDHPANSFQLGLRLWQAGHQGA